MRKKHPKSDQKEPEPVAPADLRKALSESSAALTAWQSLTPLARRDFISWINESKQAQTRARRIERCRENLISGKRRPCCYAVVPMDFYKALRANTSAKAQWSRLTASEKRDLTDWIESAGTKIDRKFRIERACELLSNGNSHI